MNDIELEGWRAQWQTVALPPTDLRARVERETRMMRRSVVGELVVTVACGGGSVAWAVLSRRTDVLVLAFGTWVFIVIAWAISLFLRRDAWAPAAVSTAAFLDLSILRCRRRREAIVAQGILYVLILVFDLAWIYLFGRQRDSRDILSLLTSGAIAWIWPVTAALGFAAVRWHERLTRELETLQRVRASLADNGRQPTGEEPWQLQIETARGSGKKKRRGGLSARS
ncbi:MAG TPA: hypothetical protein VGF24_13550 [Vicinamibacterales bacterium]|jgi:hypothetical protein